MTLAIGHNFKRLLGLVFIGLILTNIFLFAVSVEPVLGSPGLALKWTRNLGSNALDYAGALAADLVGDGRLEIVVTGGSEIGGTNGLVTALDATTGAVIWQVTSGAVAAKTPFDIADIDNNGTPEIVVYGHYPVVLHGSDGSTYWQNTAVHSYNDQGVIFDIDADGYSEIFVSSGRGPDQGYDYFTMLSYDGRILLQNPTSWHPCWGGLSFGDPNSDGTFILYQGDRCYGYDTSAPYKYGEWGVRALDAATLTPLWNDSDITCSSHCPIVADVDKDGTLDVIAMNQGTGSGGLIVLNGLTGAVSTLGGKYRKNLSLGLPSHSQPAVYDIDGDGNLELINCRNSNPKIWDLYDWKLDYTLPVTCDEPPKVGNVDGDGTMEIIAVDTVGQRIYIFDKNYVQSQVITGLRLPRAFTLVQDVDNDGYNELVVTSSAGYVYCYDTTGLAPTPKARSDSQFYSERHCGAAEYVPPPGPLAPVISQPTPVDGATEVAVRLSQLSFSLTDYQADLMDYAVTTSPNIGSGGDTDKGKGRYSISVSNLDYSTTYSWAVSATDGMHSNSKTFTFTTESLPPPPPWYNSAWPCRRAITIDHTKVSGDQTNFPVLIELTDIALAGKAQPDGDDFVFTDTSQAKLSHEIELYESGTGHLVAWVKIPLLSSTADTVLYMYYGNPSSGNQQDAAAVWDASNKLVLHLDEKTGIHYDSTTNGNNGTPFNGVLQGVSGKVDGVDTFDGSNDYIDVAYSGTLAGYTEAFTASFWIKPEATNRRQAILNKWNTGTNQMSWFIEYNPSGLPTRPFGFFVSQDGTNYREWHASFVPAANTWYYVTVVWEANVVPKFYINGNQVPTVGTYTTASIYNNVGVPLHIGRCTYNTARYFDGSLDEIRISNPARSRGYILTCYYNQLNPSAFYTIGAEEALPGEPVITDPYPAEDATNIPVTLSELSFDIADYQHDLMSFTVTTNPDIGFGSQTNVPNGRYTLPVSGLAYATMHTWTVAVTDGTHETTKTYGFTTELAPAVDDIIFDSQFDMGNLINVTYQSSAPGYRNYTAAVNYTVGYDPVAGRTNNDKHWWFYFSMDNVAGKTVTISIVNGTTADYSTSPTAGNRWTEIEPVFSYDNITWERLPLSGVTFNRAARTFTMNVTVPPAQSKIWLAPLPPYNIAKRDALFAEFASSPYLAVTSLGTTPGGQQLKVATITDPEYSDAGKFKSYVIAQQHNGEVPGSWNAEGLIRFLLSDDPTAAAIRRSYIFKIIPIVNVDGVYQGICRYTPLRSGYQYDLNRDWSSRTQPEIQWIWNDLLAFKPNSFNDMHATINTEVTSPKEALTYSWSTADATIIAFRAKIKLGGYPETVSGVSGYACSVVHNSAALGNIKESVSWENPFDELSTNPGIKLTVNDWMSWGAGWAKGNYLYFGDAPATLTVATFGSGTVSRNDTGPYHYGSVVSLTAIQDAGWAFSHWTGDLLGSQNPATLVMTGTKSVTAVFAESGYTLTINTEGSGFVSKAPDYATYAPDTDVTLTAIALPGWTFSYWTGDLSGSSNPATITMTSDKSATAVFTVEQYTLTVNVVGEGSVTKVPDQSAYDYGTSVTLTAIADPGWTFAGWTGDLTSSANPDTVDMTSDRVITATFTQNQYILTANIVGNGIVTKEPDKATYTYNNKVTLTASANSGWTFAGWSGDLTGTQNPVDIYMTTSKAVTATFTPELSTLTVNIVGSGSVSRNNTGPYYYGDAVELTATPDSGWAFSHWTGDLSGSANPNTVVLDTSKSVSAVFTAVSTQPWWDNSWKYRRTITINHLKVASDQTNFVVVIDITDSSLSGKAQIDGDDFVFTSADNVKLSHEIELYDSSTGHLVVWVKVPDLSSTTDTTIYMYYGNPSCASQQGKTAVWDTNYKVILHLNENTGTHFDSTSNHNDGTPSGPINQGTAGKIDGCDEFTGGYVGLPRVLSTETQFTFSAWIYPRTGARYFISEWTNNQGAFLQVVSDNTIQFYINGQFVSKSVVLNQWQYVVGTFDGTTARLWVNGGSPSSKATSPPTWPSQSMFVGDRSDHLRKFNGFIDEVRVSRIARSNNWINTEYNNQRDPSTFYAVGSEQDRDAMHYTLTVNVVGSGSVVKVPDQATYVYGTVVQLTAVPADGWSFTGWSGDAAGPVSPTVVVITGDNTVTATFTENPVSTYTLSVNIVGQGQVNLDAVGPYPQGTSVQLTAVAAAGWSFSGWSGALSGTDNPATIVMDADKSVTATFAQIEYSVTVTVAPSSAAGTVSADIPGPYHLNDVVTLTPSANPGYTFFGWSGDGEAGAGDIWVVTVTGNMEVTATFTQDQYALTVTTVGNGLVIKSPDQAFYVYGDVVQLTADPDDGWTFSGWSGDLSGSNNPGSITMTGSKFVTATFTDNLRLYLPFTTGASDFSSYNNDGVINGGVTHVSSYGGAYAFAGSASNPQYISVADSPTLGGDGTYAAISLEFWLYPTELQNGRRIIAKRASAAAGSSYQVGFQTSGAANRLYFDVWNTAASPYYLEGWYDTSLAANQWYHVVCTYSSGAGPNRVDVMKIYINGEAKTLSFNTGVVTGNIMQSNTKPLEIGRGISGSTYYYFQGYIDEVQIYSEALSAGVALQHYDASRAVHADYALAVSTVGSGSVIKSPDQALYAYGTVVQLTANTASGWSFEGWGGDLSGSVNPESITMDGAKTVTATFTEIPVNTYTLSVSVVGQGQVNLDKVGPYPEGTVVELTAVADSGWSFSAWSGALSGSVNPTWITMDGDKSVTATFTEDNPLLIDANFDSGSIGSYTVNGNEVSFSMRLETLTTGEQYAYWAHFKVTNTLDKEITFRVTNAAEVPFLTSTTSEAQLVYSYDGDTWHRLTTHSYSAGVYSLTQSFTGNEVYIATFFPFSYTEMQSFVSTADASPWVEKTVLGLSEQGRDVDLLTVTNPSIPIADKTVIYIIGRQHSAETASSHMLRGLVNFLISADPTAERLRDDFVWYIVPMVNPDGVYLGSSRATADLRNANRDWKNTETAEINLVKTHVTSIDTAYGVDFFIDWHSQMDDLTWANFVYSPSGNTFDSTLEAYTDFDIQYPSTATQGTMNDCTAREWISWNIILNPMYVFEPTPHLYTWTEASLELQGVNVAYAINQYFPITYTITASAGVGGTITPSGEVTVVSGGSQTFDITAGEGYVIADVLVDSVSVGAVSTYPFTNVVADHTISASFTPVAVTYTIVASAGAGGGIAPSGDVVVSQGADQVFTVTPDAGYHIADVVVDDVPVGTVGSYPFTNVQADHTITASFEADVLVGLLVDGEFDYSHSSEYLRADGVGQDWYESRKQAPTLLTLNTDSIGGNIGKKASLKNYGTTSSNVYLTQQFAPQTGTFSVQFDIYIDRIEDNANYDRTGHIYIGNDWNGNGIPLDTARERYVLLAFYDSTPGTDGDLQLRARTLSTTAQSWTNTGLWPTVVSGLSYDTWYTVEVTVNYSAGTYDVTFNGVTTTFSKMDIFNTGTDPAISLISFAADSDGRGDFFVDNVYASVASTASLAMADPAGAAYRWMDVADQIYSSSYQSSYQYSQATASISYCTLGNALFGKGVADNLKPNFAYQIKLVGIPGTADNELIGLAGRWWQEEWDGAAWVNGQNLNDKGDGSSPNPNDNTYLAHKSIADATSPTGLHYRYSGYLLLGYFITDSNGDATLYFETGSCYHVLWKTSQRAQTADDGPLKTVTFDPTISTAYDVDYASSTVSIFGEWERLPMGSVNLATGNYNCQIVLTEESFHGTEPLEGNWAAAMSTNISFTIAP